MTIKLKRYENNPIMTAGGNNWENLNVSNPGATVYDGKVYLLYRAEGEERRQGPGSWPVTRLGLAISEDGYHISYRHPEPVFDKSPDNFWNRFGCEDPRISKIGDTYYIVLTAMGKYGDHGDGLMYSTTEDFSTFSPLQRLMPELEQRTSGLLPAMINGKYCLFHRPMPNMWISYSNDLKSWSDTQCIFQIKPDTWYENKLGIGPAPLETPYGWLLFWHGKSGKSEYALGIMLLDKNDPGRIVKIQQEPVLTCEMPYEKKGFIDNVVYTNGAVEFNGKFFVYYGCCDHCIAAASVEVDEIYDWCRQ
ncbi:MAG: hypothetical protein WC082_01395 [Victivallales bacterium]